MFFLPIQHPDATGHMFTAKLGLHRGGGGCRPKKWRRGSSWGSSAPTPLEPQLLESGERYAMTPLTAAGHLLHGGRPAYHGAWDERHLGVGPAAARCAILR